MQSDEEKVEKPEELPDYLLELGRVIERIREFLKHTLKESAGTLGDKVIWAAVLAAGIASWTNLKINGIV